MTQTTEQARSAFLPCPFCGGRSEFNEHDELCYFTKFAELKAKPASADLTPMLELLEAWNRRAPAVLVPQVTDEMIEAANEAYCPFGDMNLAIQAALAAAPQPPEATVKQQLTVEAAPVQMPEPIAYLHECGKKPSLRTLEFSKVAIQLSSKGYKSHGLYTEQQVRELLAARGIEDPQ